jgi:hypothetical protein
MTYDLTIGKLGVETDQYDDDQAYQYVATIEQPEAPAYPGSFQSRHTNRIMIPWGAVSLFYSALEEYNPTLAITLCTGSNDLTIIPLTADLVKEIEQTAKRIKRGYSRNKPRFDGSDMDACLARVLILAWWAKYALETFGADAAIRIS